MTATDNDLRAQAAALRAKAATSFDRHDTDGALSQHTDQLTAQKLLLQAKIDEDGGKALFPALFDLEGQLVPAKLMQGRWGPYFALLDENGRITGEWFTPSKSKDARYARKADAAKGYYVGWVKAPARAELVGGNITCLHAIAVRTDGGYSEDVEIVDNGQHNEFGPVRGRWYAINGGLI